MISQTHFRDCDSLMRPLPVTYTASQKRDDPVIDPRFHPHCRLILVLSDISTLYGQGQVPGSRATRPGSSRITQKLLFYSAHLLSTPSQILQSVASQMAISARGLQEEETRHKVGNSLATESLSGRAQADLEFLLSARDLTGAVSPICCPCDRSIELHMFHAHQCFLPDSIV